MNTEKIIGFAESPQWVESAAETLQPAVLKAFNLAGDFGKDLKNFLHGTWLGHPLHPILTDIPIGAYSVTAVMDIAELLGNKDLKKGAEASLAIGLVGALGAAVSGTADWTGTSGQNRRIGLMHATINIGATILNTASFFLRRKEVANRKTALGLSFVAYGLTAFSAYLGGYLVYGQQMGVDHTMGQGIFPLEFTDTIPENDLKEGKMISAKAGDISVLLAKQNGQIYAIDQTCSHLGGPLAEGELLPGACVRCPWHDSVFSLENGKVIDGPATEPQTKFKIRIRNGIIQVALANSELLKKMDTEDQL